MSETVHSIIDFLNTRTSSTPLTSAQLEVLVAELKGKINQLSISVPGASADAVTVLYSGVIPGGPHTGAVAQSLVDTSPPGKVLTINQTDVYALLKTQNTDFHEALKAALGPASPERDATYNRLIDGTDLTGTEMARQRHAACGFFHRRAQSRRLPRCRNRRLVRQ